MDQHRPRTATLVTLVATVIAGATAVVAGSASAATPKPAVVSDSPAGSYASLKPARILDTRSGNGATKAPLGSGRTLTLQVTGRGGVPASGVSAAVLNVTAVSPTANGYLTAYPAGTPRPGVSSINFNRGWVGANLVTVGVDAGGGVSIYNHSGSVNVVADVLGYYNSPSATRTSYGSYQEAEVERLLDSRTIPGGKLPDGGYYTIPADYGPEVNPHIRALAVNVTAVNPTASGYLTAWNGDPAAIPASSSLNYTAKRVVPNMQIVPVRIGAGGVPEIGVLNRSSGTTDLIVDIVGFYDDNQLPNSDSTYASRFVPLTTPVRIVDSRIGQGMTTMRPGAQAKTVVTPGTVADYDTMAVVTNTTAISPTALTALTLWPNWSATRPNTSNLNPYPGQVVSNMTITSVADNNDFNVQNTTGTVNAVIDVTGTMEAYPPFQPPAARSAKGADAPTASIYRKALPRLVTVPVHRGRTLGS